MADKQLDELLHAIYEAVLDPERWLEVLCRCADYMDSDDTQLMVFENPSLKPISSLMSGRRFAVSTADAYVNHYLPLDPCVPEGYRTLTVDEWGCCHQFCDAKTVARSEFYQDFLIPNGVRWRMVAKLEQTSDLLINFAGVRAVGQQPFGKANLLAAKRFSGHLQQALRLSRHTQDLQSQAHLNALAIDALALSLWIVDASGKILHLNSQAANLLKRPLGGLQTKSGRLCCTHPADKQRLAALLQLATDKPAVGGIMRLHNAAAQQLFVTPLPAASPLSRDWQVPLVLILVMDKDQHLATLKLQGMLYDLSPAELRVAAALVAGKSVETYAQEAGVSLNTVRTQLKSLFSKTSTSRQSELVALFSQSPPLRS